MEISKKSWHARLYKFSYDELPNNFCEYFWKLFLAVVLLPISWIGCLFNKGEKLAENVFITIAFYLGLIFLPLAIAEKQYGALSFKSYLIGLGYIIGSIAMTSGVLYCIYSISQWQDNRTSRKVAVKEKKPNLIKERYKAFKGKYCPKINWK